MIFLNKIDMSDYGNKREEHFVTEKEKIYMNKDINENFESIYAPYPICKSFFVVSLIPRYCWKKLKYQMLIYLYNVKQSL